MIQDNPKKEAYIKALLEQHLAKEGVFRQFEFSSWGMETRPDYVVLYPDKFVYYEIKSEYDTLARLSKQIMAARGLFTEMYLVAPLKMLLEAEMKIPNFNYYCGTVAVEELERGNFVHRTTQVMKGHTSPTAVANLLWSEERKDFVKKIDISINGTPMRMTEKHRKSKEIIELVTTSDDCLKLLNELLPYRSYNYRAQRANLMLQKGTGK